MTYAIKLAERLLVAIIDGNQCRKEFFHSFGLPKNIAKAQRSRSYRPRFGLVALRLGPVLA
jgi:hypothetical protein